MNYEEIETLLSEAEAQNKLGNYSEAERLCLLSLEKTPIISAQDASKSEVRPPTESAEEYRRAAILRVRALNELSASFSRRGMTNEAILPAEEALQLSIQVNNKKEEIKSYISLGNVYGYRSEYSHALEYYSKALEINEKIEAKSELALAMGNMGLIYFRISDYPRALQYLTKALEINNEIGNKDGVARNTGNIGLVYSEINEYPRALEYYNKSIAIHEELGNKSGLALTKGNIGNIYKYLADHPRSLEFYLKTLAIYKEIGNKFGEAISIGNIGIAYHSLCDYPRALEYITKARTINEEIGNKYGVAINTQNIGNLYRTLEFEGYDTQKAEYYLLMAITMYEEMGTKNFEVHKNIAELYKSLGRWEEALKHYEHYHEIEKEVVSEEAKKKADLYEHQKQAAEREKEIELAKTAAAATLNATTSLLHRVLPVSISTRMIQGEENISDYFPSVSILFADIQGFTEISANMKAIDVVRFLNFVFGEFDRIMKKHGCEKIKTIGDGYMAVAGAPIEFDDHAERLAAAALDMQEIIHLPEDIRSTLPVESKFGIRIGLHTGSVVAGVIGQERFVYDIHSDAVNLASRMESSGEVGRVHVSSDFAEHLQARFKQTKNSKHGMHFEDRGESNIKGKGMMKTYFIEKES